MVHVLTAPMFTEFKCCSLPSQNSLGGHHVSRQSFPIHLNILASDLPSEPLQASLCALPQGLGSRCFLYQELPLALPHLGSTLLFLCSPNESFRSRLNSSHATEESRHSLGLTPAFLVSSKHLLLLSKCSFHSDLQKSEQKLMSTSLSLSADKGSDVLLISACPKAPDPVSHTAAP